ncbi:hypothetical protein THRCLA_07176, partial [Thraustotheca clavata]
MKNFTYSTLEIDDSPGTTLKDMILPNTVSSLTFKNISALKLSTALTSSWPDITNLGILSCPNAFTTEKVNWPLKLTSLNIYKSLFRDIASLPSNLTYLLERINIFVSATYLFQLTIKTRNLGNNPIKSFNNVQLSKALKFFYCEAVNFTDITIDTNTADALNSLNVWDRTNNLVGFAISNSMISNTTNCAKNGGEIKQLFRGKTNYTVTACVVSTDSSVATKQPNNDSTSDSTANTGILIGAIVGGVVLIAIAAFLFICIQRKKRSTKDSLPEATYHTHHDPSPSSLQVLNENHLAPPMPNISLKAEYGESPQKLDSQLDLAHLEQHRMELIDLIVESNKPLASNAYGEVWLGSYGYQQVAIKRLNSHQPKQVQKFIDEITLMSQLDCEYIVKFVG